MTAIAKLQIFDVALDYDTIFDQHNVPESFYPKDIKKVDMTRNFVERCMDRIPVFHPRGMGILIWQFFIIMIIFFYFFYIPIKVAV